jgi:ABC-type multidrug transport system ATPase subunit
VTKRYGVAVALRNVDLEVHEGEAVALFGHNGSGKTTLLKLVAGLLRPTAGAITVAGSPPRSVRGRIGYVGHEPYLYPYLTVAENLAFYARLYGAPAGPRLEELLERVGMAHKREVLVHTLSRGEAQRVSIARALLHDPDVLLADEPFSGLDPAAAAAIPVLLQREGRTILLASHDREHAMAVCERAVTLELGRIKSPPDAVAGRDTGLVGSSRAAGTPDPGTAESSGAAPGTGSDAVPEEPAGDAVPRRAGRGRA